MIRQIGKKTRQWLKDRRTLIREALAEGRIQIREGQAVGRCEECGQWRELDPDHTIKRSQGGSNDKTNIRWLCREDHNRLDNMPNSKKQSGKKADWQKPHKCFHCGGTTSQLLCHLCRKLSVKQ